jgi:thiosulfate/3-mercaptopyruvate sulfurtransferase
VAPLAPQEKVLVAEDFLQSTHGEIECEACHGGNAEAVDKDGAHAGMVASPSLSDPEGACGECHEEIAAAVPNSLHRTLAPFGVVMKSRAAKDMHPAVEKGLEIHCSQCHTSCGGCHVSRPAVVEGGFVNGHNFNARSDLLNQCTACHGSRIGNEFLGRRGQGDVHARKANMACIDCHSGAQLHAASPPDLKGRFHKAEAARCTDCHKDLKQGDIRNHNIHVGKVQCQVCHAQTYGNCYSCHAGKDDKGLPFYQNKMDYEDMKIGLAYEGDVPWGEFDYMLVRHIPVDPDLFAFYEKDVFARFGAVPSWKRTAPHNIQRKTWQAANCNHCHGNRDLFLSNQDLLAYEIEANRPVVVPDIRVPALIGRGRQLEIDTSRVKTERVVDAAWLKANLDRRNLVVIDARTEADYRRGHIEGAILLDPLEEGQLRWPWGSENPQELLNPESIARVFGDMGLRANSRIVVYDDQGWRAAFLLSVLDYCGARHIAFLKGGLETWRQNGYPMSTETTVPVPQTFRASPRRLFVTNNQFVRQNLDNANVVIVDVRPLDQSKGLAKHARALSVGRIPGSVKFPVAGLIMDHAQLKSPEELLWVLESRGITPDKTIVITCNTGAWAGAGFFMLRYLGYPDVRMHDAAWVGWERFAGSPGCGY